MLFARIIQNDHSWLIQHSAALRFFGSLLCEAWIESPRNTLPVRNGSPEIGIITLLVRLFGLYKSEAVHACLTTCLRRSAFSMTDTKT